MLFPNKFCDSVIYPIPSAFDTNGEFDPRAVGNYLRFLGEHGAKIILVTAGTARFNMLTDNELNNLNTTCMEFSGTRFLGLPPVPDKLLEPWLQKRLVRYPPTRYSLTA